MPAYLPEMRLVDPLFEGASRLDAGAEAREPLRKDLVNEQRLQTLAKLIQDQTDRQDVLYHQNKAAEAESRATEAESRARLKGAGIVGSAADALKVVAEPLGDRRLQAVIDPRPPWALGLTVLGDGWDARDIGLSPPDPAAIAPRRARAPPAHLKVSRCMHVLFSFFHMVFVLFIYKIKPFIFFLLL